MFTNSQSARIEAGDTSPLTGDIMEATAPSSLRRRRMLAVLPAGVFTGLAVVLVWGLGRAARIIPSALIGKPMPTFGLPPVRGRTLGLSSANLNGRVSIDRGVYGVLEAFVIDRQGRIAFKHVGAVKSEVYREKLAPLIAKLRQ